MMYSSANNRMLYTLEDTIIEGSTYMTQSEAYEYIIGFVSVYGQPKDIKLDIENKERIY